MAPSCPILDDRDHVTHFYRNFLDVHQAGGAHVCPKEEWKYIQTIDMQQARYQQIQKVIHDPGLDEIRGGEFWCWVVDVIEWICERSEETSWVNNEHALLWKDTDQGRGIFRSVKIQVEKKGVITRALSHTISRKDKEESDRFVLEEIEQWSGWRERWQTANHQVQSWHRHNRTWRCIGQFKWTENTCLVARKGARSSLNSFRL